MSGGLPLRLVVLGAGVRGCVSEVVLLVCAVAPGGASVPGLCCAVAGRVTEGVGASGGETDAPVVAVRCCCGRLMITCVVFCLSTGVTGWSSWFDGMVEAIFVRSSDTVASCRPGRW